MSLPLNEDFQPQASIPQLTDTNKTHRSQQDPLNDQQSKLELELDPFFLSANSAQNPLFRKTIELPNIDNENQILKFNIPTLKTPISFSKPGDIFSVPNSINKTRISSSHSELSLDNRNTHPFSQTLLFNWIKSNSPKNSSIYLAVCDPEISLLLRKAVDSHFGLNSQAAKVKTLQILEKRQYLKSIFVSQLENGCTLQNCTYAFCYKNSKIKALKLSKTQVLCLAEFLAQKVSSNPSDILYTPHSISDLKISIFSAEPYSQISSAVETNPIDNNSKSMIWNFLTNIKNSLIGELNTNSSSVLLSNKEYPPSKNKTAIDNNQQGLSSETISDSFFDTNFISESGKKLISLATINQNSLSLLKKITVLSDNELLVNTIRTLLSSPNLLINSFNLSNSDIQSTNQIKSFPSDIDIDSLMGFGTLSQNCHDTVVSAAEVGILKVSRNLEQIFANIDYSKKNVDNQFYSLGDSAVNFIIKLFIIICQAISSISFATELKKNQNSKIYLLLSKMAQLIATTIFSINGAKVQKRSKYKSTWKFIFQAVPRALILPLVEILKCDIDNLLYFHYFLAESEIIRYNFFYVSSFAYKNQLVKTGQENAWTLKRALYLHGLLYDLILKKIWSSSKATDNYINPETFALEQKSWLANLDLKNEFVLYYRHYEFIETGNVSPPYKLDIDLEKKFFSILDFKFLFPSEMIANMLLLESFVRMRRIYLTSATRTGFLGNLRRCMLLGNDMNYNDALSNNLNRNILNSIDPAFSHLVNYPSSTGWPILETHKNAIKHSVNPYLLFGVRRS
ncbi:hypothetical protein BB561_006969, partial [Smittium simulii]